MIIERTSKEIIFRLPSDTNIDELQELSDYLEYVEIAKKSKTKQSEVDDLVKSIKKGRWNRTKEQLGL